MSGDAFHENLKLAEQAKALAAKKGCTSPQLAIAWVRAMSERQGNPSIIPIPGATKAGRVKENSTIVQLSEEEVQEISELVDNFETVGARYPEYVPHDT